MQKLTVTLNINPKIYLKDPTLTPLGQRIIENGLLLIDKLGLENFNFRKLAVSIGSTESSVYRYFTNKHYLFVYLVNWYWEWMLTRIEINTMHLKDPHARLKKIIHLLIDSANRNTETAYIDEEVLHRVVVREGTKAYHHKLVDHENGDGFFLSYKALCKKISEVFLELNPAFQYPKALASTIIETANNNIYFARHLPRLTDLKSDSPRFEEELDQLLYHLAISAIHNQNTSTFSHKKSSKP